MTVLGRTAVLSLAVTGSACGGDDEPPTVTSGLYQLVTTSIAGDCKLDDSLVPGPLAVGAVLPVDVTASAVSVAVKVCDHPQAAPACAGLGTAHDFGMARNGDGLVGSQDWLVPGCGMLDYQTSLQVVGMVIGDSELTLTWTATITSPRPSWACTGYRPCTSTIEQRMAISTPAP